MPMSFAAHKAIVHPDRSDGANAVDGRFLRSHFTVRGSTLGSASGFMDILRTSKSETWEYKYFETSPSLQEPCVVQHHADRAFSFRILLAVPTLHHVSQTRGRGKAGSHTVENYSFRSREEGESTSRTDVSPSNEGYLVRKGWMLTKVYVHCPS